MKKIFLTWGLLCPMLGLSQAQDSVLNKNLHEVTVFGIRSSSKMPITASELNKELIKKSYYGADLPLVLNQHLPSITAHTDNGGPLGISFIRLRGMDHTRVNFSLNGIPMNDTETQGIFFNNWNDLLSSTESIEVQRGVGTSSSGAASLAGSINVLTKDFTEQAEAHWDAGLGSFQSSRNTLELQSGRMGNGSAYYLRLGNIYTRGYREHSESQVRSLMSAYGFRWKEAQLKFQVLLATAQDLLANAGLREEEMAKNRRANAFQHQEGDQFNQGIYQVTFNQRRSPTTWLNTSLYYVSGKAPYYHYFFESIPLAYLNLPNSEQGALTQALGNYQLNQRFWGGFASQHQLLGDLDWTYGFHANYFEGDHFLNVLWLNPAPVGIWPNHPVFFNTGYKKEATLFSKSTYQLMPKLVVFLDLQWRQVWFQYGERYRSAYVPKGEMEGMHWGFINPKLGTKYFFNPQSAVYLMFGKTSREPTRTDYFGDEYPSSLVKQSQIKPESVQDWELGFKHKRTQGQIQGVFSINLFYMRLKNALINTGEINSSSNALTTNAQEIIRQGLELEQSWDFKDWSLSQSLSLLDARITQYTQFYKQEDSEQQLSKTFKHVPTLLSPSMVFNLALSKRIQKNLRLQLIQQMQSRQYLDNTAQAHLALKGFAIYHLVLDWKKKEKKLWVPGLNLRFNNLFGKAYTPYGRVGAQVLNAQGKVLTQGYYFPAALQNVLISLHWDLL